MAGGDEVIAAAGFLVRIADANWENRWAYDVAFQTSQACPSDSSFIDTMRDRRRFMMAVTRLKKLTIIMKNWMLDVRNEGDVASIRRPRNVWNGLRCAISNSMQVPPRTCAAS